MAFADLEQHGFDAELLYGLAVLLGHAARGVEAQTRQVMSNLQAVLMAAGLDFSHVLKTTIYLRNMNDYQIVNDVYALYFDHSPPARVAVEVSRLPRDVLVEIDAVAAAPTDYAARVEGEQEQTSNAHLGPEEWEAQHKADAEKLHNDTMVGQPPALEPPADAVPIEEPADGPLDGPETDDEKIPPSPAPPMDNSLYSTQELDVDDLRESTPPPPLAGLKIPRPPKGATSDDDKN